MRPQDTQMCVKRDVEKEMKELPDEIYLIPESNEELGEYWSWCDDPCPTPLHSDDYAVKYVKEALLKEREWISVEDILPENDDLVMIHPEVELQDYHDRASYCKREDEWTITAYYDWGSDDYHPMPTHWMKLPEAPQ